MEGIGVSYPKPHPDDFPPEAIAALLKTLRTRCYFRDGTTEFACHKAAQLIEKLLTPPLAGEGEK
jgi:hypothetical protein